MDRGTLARPYLDTAIPAAWTAATGYSAVLMEEAVGRELTPSEAELNMFNRSSILSDHQIRARDTRGDVV